MSNPIQDVDSPVDPEDLLSDSLQTLYDYTPVTHSSAGLLFRYTLRPRSGRASHAVAPTDADPTGNPSVVTLVTPNTQAGNWALHASSIWTSALIVADRVEQLRIEEHVARERKRDGTLPLHVLELGAGTGLPSIVLAKLYTDDVHITATDYPDAELIRTLQDNVERNGVAARCDVVPYAWGSDPAVLLASTARTQSGDDGLGFDIVLATDTLWNPEFHASFLQALQLTLRRTPDARIYLVSGLHTGRYTLQSFMQALGRYGFKTEKAEEWEVGGESTRDWDIGRADGEDEAERRKWVVNIKIKWKDA